MQPPSDSFRSLSVYPSQAEILGAYSYLRENITRGSFNGIEHYLDVQFRLLREDFVACVRDGILNFRAQKPQKQVDIYDNVRIFKERRRNGEVWKIKTPILEDEDSKKFMNGSLLLFTRNNFDSFSLAKVVCKNSKEGEAVIEGVGSNDMLGGGNLKMAECCNYFDPYFNVLNALKTISSHQFPMEKYIVNVDTLSVYLPRYLLYCHNYKIKNYTLPPEMIPKFAENVGLNKAQLEAFKAALSQEFVVIQGPPGTGKTFLGVKIVETLLQNSRLWFKNSPLLVVSHKNHALDQFLEGLLPITSSLVRVGGQSKSDKLRPFNLQVINEAEVTAANKFRVHLKTMQRSLVVGMTTSVAARYKQYLEELRCPIVVVEEAAEVLEAHVVASLTQHCQHLILLGDHKQLQPITGDYTVGIKYRLGVSLFERMINNGIQCYQLDVQHRMRPEISELLRAKIYPFLKDHESVLKRPPVQGVAKNLFFLHHQGKEENSNVTSKKNLHEAKFLVALAKYLVQNGYEASNLAILATYSGQVRQLQQLAQNQKLLENVKISTLDAFQGQEADIILFSLVRSDDIGFLQKQNRICVGLSRARNGFYIMGNMDLLSQKSNLWFNVKKSLQKQGSLDNKFPLKCQNHPERVAQVQSAEDFLQFKDGYCNKPCEQMLQCGHRCCLLCHAARKEHNCGNGCVNCKNILPQPDQPFINLIFGFFKTLFVLLFKLICFILERIFAGEEPEVEARRSRSRYYNRRVPMYD